MGGVEDQCILVSVSGVGGGEGDVGRASAQERNKENNQSDTCASPLNEEEKEAPSS